MVVPPFCDRRRKQPSASQAIYSTDAALQSLHPAGSDSEVFFNARNAPLETLFLMYFMAASGS